MIRLLVAAGCALVLLSADAHAATISAVPLPATPAQVTIPGPKKIVHRIAITAHGGDARFAVRIVPPTLKTATDTVDVSMSPVVAAPGTLQLIDSITGHGSCSQGHIYETSGYGGARQEVQLSIPDGQTAIISQPAEIGRYAGSPQADLRLRWEFKRRFDIVEPDRSGSKPGPGTLSALPAAVRTASPRVRFKRIQPLPSFTSSPYLPARFDAPTRPWTPRALAPGRWLRLTGRIFAGHRLNVVVRAKRWDWPIGQSLVLGSGRTTITGTFRLRVRAPRLAGVWMVYVTSRATRVVRPSTTCPRLVRIVDD